VVAAVGVALIPLAAHERSRIGTGYIEGLSLRRRALGVPEDFLVGLVVKFDATWEQLLEAFALAVAAVGVGLAAATRRHAVAVIGALAVAAAGVPFLLAVAGTDYLNTRNVIAGCLPALLLVAAGFAEAPAWVAGAGVAALCAVGVASTVVVAADATYHRSDFRGSAEALGPLRGARVVVVPGLAGEIAMGRYLPGLVRVPAGGVAVAEVDFASPRSSKLGGAAVARPRVPPVLPPPFRLAGRRYAETYTVLRYRAPRPVVVKPDVLARAAAPVVGAALVLVQR
jgi:hypothetical protein